MTREQQKIWEQEKRKVRRITDRVGMSVDRAILETVAILRLLGIHTDGSCGGHVDRARSPYVAFRSPRSREARRLADKTEGLAQRARHVQRALQYNAAELQLLVPYLDRFYQDRNVPQSRRLILQGFGVIGYRLTSQSADLVHLTPRHERRALLDEQRQELRAFTEFLKGEFFGS